MVVPMTSGGGGQGGGMSVHFQPGMSGGLSSWSVSQGQPGPGPTSPDSSRPPSSFQPTQSPLVRDYPCTPLALSMTSPTSTPGTGPPRTTQRSSPPGGHSQRLSMGGSGRPSPPPPPPSSHSSDWRTQSQGQGQGRVPPRYMSTPVQTPAPAPTSGPPVAPPPEATTDTIESACRTVETLLNRDVHFPSLFTSLVGRESSGLRPVSGLVDHDYPQLIQRGLMPQKLFTLEHQAQIPPELREMVASAPVGSCHMGLFPEISRAWMTIDSDLYLWDFRDGGDLSFYDGLREGIIGVALVPVKPNVFKSSIRHLLCVSTPSQVLLLGFILVDMGGNGGTSFRPTMEIVRHPIFTLSSESLLFPVIVGAANGRIFLGGSDGSVHEIGYQAGRGWLRNRCWKSNLTRNVLSVLIPKFLSSSKADAIAEIQVDNRRGVVFTLHESGAISAYDMGEEGAYFSRVGTMSMETIINSVLSISKKTLESTLIHSILSIAPIESGELSLTGVSDSGARLFFTCYERAQVGVRAGTRPNTLQLAHVRLPPGYSPMSPAKKPSSVHKAFCAKGMFLLACTGSPETDVLWFINPFMYPSPVYAELTNVHVLPGVTHDIKEIKDPELRGELGELPDVMTQHLSWQRQVVVLTGSGTLVFRMAKPFELLRDLLLERHGPESLKSHFELVAQREQPLANALLVAVHPFLFPDNDLHNWATKALFTFGGDSSETTTGGGEEGQRQGQRGLMFNIPRPNYDAVEFNPAHVSTPTREALTPGQQEVLVQQQRLSGVPMTTSGGMGGVQGQAQAQSPQSPLTPGAMPMMSSTFREAVSPSPGSTFESPLQSVLTPPYSSHPHFQGVLQEQGPFLPQQSYPTPTPTSGGGPQEWPFSPRHDALYLLVARVLCPFWNMKLVRTAILEGSKATNIIVPNISGEEVSYAIGFLHSIFSFLSSNATLYIPGRSGMTFGSTGEGRRVLRLEGEKNSLSQLRSFLGLTLEVLGMWKILCDHQFHIVLHDIDERLQKSTMRDLVVGGHSMVSLIINALINKYLGDHAAVDAISLRLREVCPSLFKNEDAIGSKVAEILSKAKGMTDTKEKETLLKESLSLCEQICGNGHVNVGTFCRQFAELGFPLGSVRLCISAAKASDPNQLALTALKAQGTTGGDPLGLHAYQARADIYKIVFEILDSFVGRSTTRQSPLTARKSEELLAPETAKVYAEETMKAILNSEDEAFHITLYNWFLERKLFDQLLDVKHPFLDAFLQRAAESVVSGKWGSEGGAGTHGGGDTRVLDLLWRHHEMNQNHLAAATILSKLADSTTTGLSLSQRLEYLSRAVICCKSGGRWSDMLETLEDKLEVAQIQKLILDMIGGRVSGVTTTTGGEDTSLTRVKTLQDAMTTLNGQLFNITVLYTEFAVPFKLHEAKLEIFHAAGHSDRTLIESLWADIVEEELSATSRQSMESQLEVIRRKLVSLGRKYLNTPPFFPLEYLVEHLESMKPSENVDPGWVFGMMTEIGVPFPDLLLVYEKLWKRVTRRGSVSGVDTQIAKVVMVMVNAFARGQVDVRSTFVQRSELVEKCKDMVAGMIVEFSSRFDASAAELTNALNNVKERLESAS